MGHHTAYNNMFAQGCLEESFWGLASRHHIPSLGAKHRLRSKALRIRFVGVTNAKRYITWEAKVAASCGGVFEYDVVVVAY